MATLGQLTRRLLSVVCWIIVMQDITAARSSTQYTTGNRATGQAVDVTLIWPGSKNYVSYFML